MDLRERPAHNAPRHPWELARFDFFRRLLHNAAALSSLHVLDVGSGDAWFARQLLGYLPPQAHVTCWDAEYDRTAAGTLDPLDERMSLVSSRPDGAFDLIVALDVLEHIEDDTAFLRDVVDASLAADGRLLMSVPAWSSLFTTHDTALLHYRRYDPRQARGLLASAGLRILACGGLFSSLLAPRVARKLGELVMRPAPPSQAPPLRWSHGPAVTSLVRGVLSLDNAASSWAASHELSFPGLSWWALCQKQ